MAVVGNVVYWLEMNGYDPNPVRVDRILQFAKNSPRILSEAEIREARRKVEDHEGISPCFSAFIR